MADEKGWPCDGCGTVLSPEDMKGHEAGAGFGMVLCPDCSEKENESGDSRPFEEDL